MSITVYSKPQCVQCDQTKKALDREGLVYGTIDVTSNPEAYDKVVSLGFRSVPVVVAGDEMWAGFRPDRIKTITQ